MLRLNLELRQLRYHRAPKLQDIEPLPRIGDQARVALMLMPPDHQIDEIGKELRVDAGDVPIRPIVLLPVLVDHEDIGVGFLVLKFLELDLALLKGVGQAAVLEVADSVERDLIS